MVLLSLLLAFPSLTGYAGSPVSNGSCAVTCHGSGVFEVNVTGFPETYVPTETYEITVSPAAGNISNFNACVLDESNVPQGSLQGGQNTSTYTHPGEGTGVHGSVNNQSSYTFSWTAPSDGSGTILLYLAAHQGGAGGPNQSLVLSTVPALFIRGDVNGDFAVTISDLSFIAFHLFSGGPAPSCWDAADVNEDGAVTISDVVYLANFLFLGGSPPFDPYPGCGFDPTIDPLDCASHPCQLQ